MTDAETTAAIQALEHRIRERDEAMRNGEDYPDAGPFAAEFIAALRAKAGWRPTPAKAYPAPKAVAPGSGSGPSPETRALMEEARERSAEASARLRPDKHQAGAA